MNSIIHIKGLTLQYQCDKNGCFSSPHENSSKTMWVKQNSCFCQIWEAFDSAGESDSHKGFLIFHD